MARDTTPRPGPVARPEAKPDDAFVDDEGTLRVPADSDTGTIHDPNSITTGTDMEPERKHPPKAAYE